MTTDGVGTEPILMDGDSTMVAVIATTDAGTSGAKVGRVLTDSIGTILSLRKATSGIHTCRPRQALAVVW